MAISIEVRIGGAPARRDVLLLRYGRALGWVDCGGRLEPGIEGKGPEGERPMVITGVVRKGGLTGT